MSICEVVKVYEYAPKKFQQIRLRDGIDRSIIKKSLSAKKNRDQVFKAGESQGKSGSFFFFSHDRQFIIKTMYKDELEIFLRALPDYYRHLRDNPDSLIARIYGVYTVEMQDIEKVSLLLMANTIRCENPENIQNIFDLKGSMINRVVKITKQTKSTSTLKDINLLEIKKQYKNKEIDFMRFKTEDLHKIKEQMKKDIDLLCKFKLMDYSLLFVVERYSPEMILT